ncbi:DNA polymerase III subunit delta [Nakamurella aerolata]|uniref:DNA-directed DNA polymerase n=1 Tax=Nakamurella aerolata TaxID=1656892 RepID=A0A849ABL1_9ACTN|nr:DNA polymerase III subunit delta [Nakamurella aerolata]NNG36528.1 DNA polymerase III subunit delta [Nakamurella aerolata]
MAEGPGPLVLISGDEPLLIDRAVTRTAAAVRKREPEVERRDSDVAGLSPQAFADLVAPSLFAEPRLVVLRGGHEAAKDLATALISYAGDVVDGVTVVLQHNGGTRNKPIADAFRRGGAAVLPAQKITRPAERVDFVRAEIKHAGGTCTPSAAQALVDAVGNDLRELAAAAGQLASDTGGMVDDTAVARYYRGRAEVSGFAVADKAVAGDLAGALEAARWASDIGVPPVLVADALADGVRTIAKVAGARPGNSYAMAAELGMPAWKIDRARSAVRQWTPAGLAAAMAATAQLNADVKGVAADADYAVERAITAMVRARRAGRNR